MEDVLITGGAGFVGSNLAHRLLSSGSRVTVFDNLSRRGTEANLGWLRRSFDERLRFEEGDIRDPRALADVVRGKSAIFHFAAQVAVTSSLVDPRHDFEVNALGTLNLLEAVRPLKEQPALFFTSTNKVYGGLEGIALREGQTRWRFANGREGIDEQQSLDFHSPYGCSKGAADQYMRDYARMYGMRTVVFRMSCVYGPRQFGNEDQGWVAHFLIRASRGEPITIYGDGKQVRDILHVDDLLDAFQAANERIDEISGEVFNIGGGANNSVAIWSEFGELVGETVGRKPRVCHVASRPGDQLIYVSDIGKVGRRLGWQPRIGTRDGVRHLVSWIRDNRDLFG